MSKFTVPKGTQDVLPLDWRIRHRILDAARVRFEAAGYGRITTPTFEHSELFHRGVGEATDIVAKETYTFDDRGGRSLTLRPEGTAGVARAFIGNGLHREAMPVKLWYFAPMFRYEKPQAGRLREHYQIGCEAFGSEHPAVDAEMITMLDGLYRSLGVPGVSLHINTIGSRDARAAYRERLIDYLRPFESELDADSRTRLETNPLRILDSKNPRTREIIADAPNVLDSLTAEDQTHFATLQQLLDAAQIEYEVTPTLVRGLDYYTRTVFEFRCSALGAQDTIGGGGRYDGLVETLGGKRTPAVGFGSGIERITLAMSAGEQADESRSVGIYIGAAPGAGDITWARVFHITTMLRELGYTVELDLAERSLKGQTKQAGRLQADVRVEFDDLGGRFFIKGDFEGSDLPPNDEASVKAIEAQMVALAAAEDAMMHRQ